jgi:hypothetical protein
MEVLARRLRRAPSASSVLEREEYARRDRDLVWYLLRGPIWTEYTRSVYPRALSVRQLMRGMQAEGRPRRGGPRPCAGARRSGPACAGLDAAHRRVPLLCVWAMRAAVRDADVGHRYCAGVRGRVDLGVVAGAVRCMRLMLI